jgi:transposase InsO family protein
VGVQGSPGKRERQGRCHPAELKREVLKAYLEGTAKAPELAKVYGISDKAVYEWARLYREKGEAWLDPKPRKSTPQEPGAIEKAVAAEIVETKKAFGWFGVKRLAQWLRRAKLLPVTEHQVGKALKAADLVPPKAKKRKRAEVVRRFERSEPNQLWQVDITMWTMAKGLKVYLIAFMDDHSRYIVGWGLFAAQGSSQVLEVLRAAIGQYGAPKELLSDQGRQFFAWRGKCPFQKELAREGIQHVVSRSHHPQTLGKIESFWKHLKDEFLSRVVTGSINDLRDRLRLWIDSYYNFQRPHQGIENHAPADRYFKMARQVRDTIEKGVQENAERMALGKEPLKPFYMVGRMGEQEVVIRQEGGSVVMNVGTRELEKLRLKEDDHEEAERGGKGGGGAAGGEGESAGGAPGTGRGEDGGGDLPGNGPLADAVLQAGGADDPGDDARGGGEPVAEAGTGGAGGAGEPRGAQPAAPAGEPEDGVAASPDAEALPHRGEDAGEAGAGTASEGGGTGGSR